MGSHSRVFISFSNRGVRYRVEDVVLDAQAAARRGTKIGGNAAKCCQGLAAGLRRRLKVVALIWPHMLAIATCYLVTMAVFPGMESEVVSCNLLDWMPILLLSVFHATDLAGKLVAGLGHSWSKGELVLWPLARLCLLPLILLCALPRQKPVFQNELIPLLLTGTLGISSGLFGSLPLIRPHPGQPPCLLAGLTPGSPQFKP